MIAAPVATDVFKKNRVDGIVSWAWLTPWDGKLGIFLKGVSWSVRLMKAIECGS